MPQTAQRKEVEKVREEIRAKEKAVDRMDPGTLRAVHPDSAEREVVEKVRREREKGTDLGNAGYARVHFT